MISLAGVPVLMAHIGWFPGDTCEGGGGISHFSLLEGLCFPPIVHSENLLQSQPGVLAGGGQRMESVFPMVC